MAKIGALYYNELIKIKKRVSILIIVLIMIAAIIGISGLFKFGETFSLNPDSWVGTVDTDAFYQEQREEYQKNLDELELSLDAAREAGESEKLFRLCEEKISILTELTRLDLEEKYTDIYNTDFRTALVDEIASNWQQVYRYTVMKEDFPNQADEADCRRAQQAADDLTVILEKKDYAGYVAYSKALIDQTDVSPEEKAIMKEKWDILLKLDPTGGVGKDAEFYGTSNAEAIANAVESLNQSILYERDVYIYSYSNDATLTPSDIETYRDLLTVLRYSVDNGIEIKDLTYDNASVAYSIVAFIANVLITLLLLIIAGGMISSEITSGSIKSLIIAPVRRWKIFTAKFLALLTLGLLLTLIKYICLTGTQTLFWPDQITPYVYASGGTAHVIPYYLYQLLYMLADLLPILTVAFFALMMSATGRSTALAVGLSMGIYFGGSSANAIITDFFDGDWLRFIPFNNLDVAARLFPSPMQIQSDGSAVFTLIYILVLSYCLVHIAFDSFIRRDI